MSTKDKQARKWQLTINNPLTHDQTHETIKEILSSMKSCIYWCMSDEIGGKESTYHTHVFFACSSAMRFSTVKRLFPTAHIEIAKGSSHQNRDYVFKQGKKWAEKSETSVPGTLEEDGEIPQEHQGERNDLTVLYDLIKQGYSDADIVEENSNYILRIKDIEQVRQALRKEEYKERFRELEVVYIYGDTGLGKSRYVMETYGYGNCFRFTQYKRVLFDAYDSQDVLIFEEFRSELTLTDILNYLDGYPLQLPSRYHDKTACYSKVFIISNLPLECQYIEIQDKSAESWNAFVRRIHRVYHFVAEGEFEEIPREHFFIHHKQPDRDKVDLSSRTTKTPLV